MTYYGGKELAAAFRTVRRHMFMPGVEPERAYRDEPLIIKSDPHRVPISSSSQPAIMARMLEQLDVRLGHRVLEIGTGSGYNAALLAQLVGETGAVVSVDIDVDLVEDARARLAECGVSQVTVGCGDGGSGQGFRGSQRASSHFQGYEHLAHAGGIEGQEFLDCWIRRTRRADLRCR